MWNYDYCSILMIAVRVPPVRGNENCASSNEDHVASRFQDGVALQVSQKRRGKATHSLDSCTIIVQETSPLDSSNTVQSRKKRRRLCGA